MCLMASSKGKHGGLHSYKEPELRSPEECEMRCLQEEECYASSLTMLPSGPKCRLYKEGMYKPIKDNHSVLYMKYCHDSKLKFTDTINAVLSPLIFLNFGTPL